MWAAIGDSDGLASVLDGNPQVRWVQLPWAGIEPYVDVIRAHADLIWTCAKGVYAEPVAEHALALALAGRRNLGRYSRADLDQGAGTQPPGRPGHDPRRRRHRRFAPVAAGPVRLRRHGGPPQSRRWRAARVVGSDRMDEALEGAEVVVLALALVPETEGIIDARRLALLAPDATLVNVACGRHAVTDDLVAALGTARWAAPGWTSPIPSPCPTGIPCGSLPNAIITPHTANTPEMAIPLLSARVTDNVRRWAAGEPLAGPLDPAAGAAEAAGRADEAGPVSDHTELRRARRLRTGLAGRGG